MVRTRILRVLFACFSHLIVAPSGFHPYLLNGACNCRTSVRNYLSLMTPPESPSLSLFHTAVSNLATSIPRLHLPVPLQQEPSTSGNGMLDYTSLQEFSNRVEIYAGRHSRVWTSICTKTKKSVIVKASPFRQPFSLSSYLSKSLLSAAETTFPVSGNSIHFPLPEFPRHDVDTLGSNDFHAYQRNKQQGYIKDKMVARHFTQVSREIEIMKKINNQGVVMILGTFQDARCIYIVQVHT